MRGIWPPSERHKFQSLTSASVSLDGERQKPASPSDAGRRWWADRKKLTHPATPPQAHAGDLCKDLREARIVKNCNELECPSTGE